MAKGFSKQIVQNAINASLARIDKAIIRRMQYLGEMLVNHAREHGSYTDITGNLRNSVGYILTRNGVTIAENFMKVTKGGEEGPAKAKQFAESLKTKHGKGTYSIIVVCGMDYADYVESTRNVLAATEMQAKSEFPRMISELKLNIKKMKV